jgi:hypothetical protein
MKIATILNAHGNTQLVADTIDAIQTWVSKDILMLVDDKAWEVWGENVELPVHKMRGLYHNFRRAPYRNLTCGLKTIVDFWEGYDWYCYCEYDVLFTSDGFKKDLEDAQSQNVWCLGNDYREANYKFPFLENIIQAKLGRSQYLLGCCVFYSGAFLRKLKEVDFFNKFLLYTNGFTDGFFPGYEEQGGYDFGEHLYPTLAAHYGGGVKQLAGWNAVFEQWQGNFQKYPMRWKPELNWNDNFHNASIMHPVKEYADIRWFHRTKRDRHGKI